MFAKLGRLLIPLALLALPAAAWPPYTLHCFDDCYAAVSRFCDSLGSPEAQQVCQWDAVTHCNCECGISCP